MSNDAADKKRFAMELGEWLRKQRLVRKLNQVDVAAVMGVERASVSRWETGDGMPSPYHLHLFKSFLKEMR